MVPSTRAPRATSNAKLPSRIGSSFRRSCTSTSRLLESLESRVLLSASHVATHFSIQSQSNAVTDLTGLTPSQIRQAYGIDQIMFGSVTGDGSGQTIAIIDAYNDPNIASDLHAFDAAYGLSDPTLTVINQTGGTTLPTTDPAGAGNSWALTSGYWTLTRCTTPRVLSRQPLSTTVSWNLPG